MKDKIISILCWILGLCFLFFGMVFITNSFIAGALWLVACGLTLPPMIKKIRENVKLYGSARVALILVIAFAAVLATPVPDDSDGQLDHVRIDVFEFAA